jgi:hypothetical protein
MALTALNVGVARLAKTMPCWVRRQIIGPNCSVELGLYGMFPWEGQYRDTPAFTAPRWTTDTPPPTPPPTPIVTPYGVIGSFAPGGGTNLPTGTTYLGPVMLMQKSATLGAVEIKLPIPITILGISVTMSGAALAVGHSINFRNTIAGVDDNSMICSIAAGQVDGFVTGGPIALPANTAWAIKAVQVGVGGDNIGSFMVTYQS